MERSTADDLVQKAAVMAVMYYPEIQADDPEYKLSTDVAWCLEDAGEIADEERDALTDLIARLIIDPTSHREALCEYVYGLVPAAE